MQRHALVTGAGRGIGREIARELGRRGYRLHLTSRTEDELRRVAEEAPSGPHVIYPADLSDPEQITGLVDALSPDGIDLLVVNAGTAVSASIEQTSLDEWDRIFNLNVRSPFLLTQALIPRLRVANGRIIVVGSVVSTVAYPNQGAYTASKHALYGFTKVLAQELHQDGILVQTILPGGVATDMVRRMRPDIDSSDLIQPVDVARAVGSLLDAEGSAVTDEIRLRRHGKIPWA
ncbi:MAG TPA: SDR family oxidoreductase [Alkalispirochaeta sp.]|nr:SDR family oxidoreductase [Alkalispirochaeta sp.]